MHRPMERHDGLAGAGRARDTRRAAVFPFDELPLGRVKEDRPLLPRVVERSLQCLHIRHHPEAALRVRMRERIGARHGRHCAVRRTAGRKLQQRLGGLARQMIGEVEQRVLRRGPHVVQPLDRHAVAEQVVVRRVGEDRGPRRRWSTWCSFKPGCAGFTCRSNAAVLTAFCSSPVSLTRLSVKVSAMRNCIRLGSPTTVPDVRSTAQSGDMRHASFPARSRARRAFP